MIVVIGIPIVALMVFYYFNSHMRTRREDRREHVREKREEYINHLLEQLKKRDKDIESKEN